MRSALCLTVFAFCSVGSLNAQSLTVVSSDNDVEYGGSVNGSPIGDSDTDPDAVAIFDVDGYFGSPEFCKFYNDISASLSNVTSTYVELTAYADIDLSCRGDLYYMPWEYYALAISKATVEAQSANGIDDVELEVTFNGGVNPYSFSYGAGLYMKAGSEYWAGEWASSYWTYGPSYSALVSEEWWPTEDPWAVYDQFNLIVESGSEIELRAQATHGYQTGSSSVTGTNTYSLEVAEARAMVAIQIVP